MHNLVALLYCRDPADRNRNQQHTVTMVVKEATVAPTDMALQFYIIRLQSSPWAGQKILVGRSVKVERLLWQGCSWNVWWQ